MRRHEYVKTDCKCTKRATRMVCKHCGLLEYKSPQELRRLAKDDAACTDPRAPQVPAKEAFKGMMGARFDCLAADWETYADKHPDVNKPQEGEDCDNC